MIKYFSMPVFPVYFGLAKNEKDFAREMKRLGVDNATSFILPGADMSTHVFSRQGATTTIVCAHKRPRTVTVAQYAAMMAHEATHVWQTILECIGENSPGREIEAYHIQYITQCLIAEMERA